jgi:hypothetical protein
MTYFYDPCDPCCGEGAEPDTCDCDTSYQYTLTMPAMANTVGSPNCTTLTGTHTLSFVGGATCPWKEFPGLGSGGHNFTISTFSAGVVRLTIQVQEGLSFPSRGTYECTSFDCETGGVFTFLSSTACTGWPATITVSKV